MKELILLMRMIWRRQRGSVTGVIIGEGWRRGQTYTQEDTNPGGGIENWHSYQKKATHVQYSMDRYDGFRCHYLTFVK